MTQGEIDSLGGLDALLDGLNSSKFNASIKFNTSVVEPNGIAQGWMTLARNKNRDGSESLWYGLKHEGDCFRFEESESSAFDFFDGDQRMYSFGTLQEVTAFLRGILWTISNG